MKLLTVLVAGSVLLAGCGMNSAVTEVNNGCDWTDTILVSQEDVLSDGTADQILAHNLVRQRLCN